MTVATQTSPPKEIQPQNYVIATEQHPRNQAGKEPVLFLSCSNNCPSGIQESEQHTTTTYTGDSTIQTLTKTTPRIEEGLVRYEQTNEFYHPSTSTLVLKWKQETLYVTLHFENNLTVDVLVDSGAYFSAIARNDLDTIK